MCGVNILSVKAKNVRRAWCRRVPLLLILITFLSTLGTSQIRPAKRVLLVEDQMSAPAVEAVARDFESNLTAKSPDPIEFYRESLDTILIPDGAYQSQVRDWYERKYSNRRLDLIVAIGPASHDFIQTEHERFFRGVPVVFCLDIKHEHEGATPEPDFTGIWMEFDPVSTLNAARQLLPGTRHVAVIAGSGLFDQMLMNSVKTKLQGYGGVDFTYLTGVELSALLKRVRGLSDDTVVLYLTVTKDRYERHMFVTYTLPLVSASANVPVFGMIDLMVPRQLIVGGRVTSFADQGPAASEIAFRVLQGEKPEKIPALTMPNRFAFNWKVLQRWGLDASRLPVGSAVLDRDPTVWERFHRVIEAVIALVLLLTGLIVYLLIERSKRLHIQKALEADILEREKAEAALVDLSSRLIDAQEEQCSRIARELHDDFSQRLSVVSMNLRRTARVIPRELDQAVARINELCDQTDDIGADLHKMSRNLHSSTLDVLGLEDGIESLCGEFEKQQGVRIHFTSRRVPRELPSKVCLCFFRIAQEALRNVKKHSGAKEAVVQLDGNGKEIVLVIADSGVGFDLRESAFKVGLGLRSMQERLRALGGTIEINSKKGAGTEILARAPVSELDNGRSSVSSQRSVNA
jgi:signal transduction histidine kinase